MSKFYQVFNFHKQDGSYVILDVADEVFEKHDSEKMFIPFFGSLLFVEFINFTSGLLLLLASRSSFRFFLRLLHDIFILLLVATLVI